MIKTKGVYKTMNIRQISSNLSAANLGTKIGFAVLNKNMDAMKTAGEGMVRMIEAAPTPSKVSMERSVNPHIGGNVDMLV